MPMYAAFFYNNITWHSTLKLFTCNLYISSAASTFGVCVVLFFLPIFHRFILECFCMKARPSKANEMYVTQNLNKLAKYSELEPSPLPMRYSAFSWERDGNLGGISLYHRLLTGFGCEYFFRSHFRGKNFAVNRDSWFSFRL